MTQSRISLEKQVTLGDGEGGGDTNLLSLVTADGYRHAQQKCQKIWSLKLQADFLKWHQLCL